MAESPAPAPRAEDIAVHRGLLIFSLMLAVSLHTIDSTIVNVALPKMQGTLGATFDQISWVVTSYIIATVMLTPLVGWAANRFGIKRLMILAVTTFTLSSVLCGLAVTLEAMLASRLLQGASGAPLIPLAMTTMNRLSASSGDRAKMMALFGIGTMVGPVIGPSLGGFITDFASWRWVFFINLPVGILAVVCFGASMRAGMRMPGHPLNMIGFLTLAIAVGALQLALDRGESEAWFESSEIIIYALVVGAMLWMFAVNSRYAARPFLPMALFRDRNFVVGMFLVVIAAGIMTSSLVLQPPMMQSLMGYPVLDTGLLLIWRGVGMMAGMMLTPKLAEMFSPRVLLIFGGVLMTGGLWPFVSLTTDATPFILAAPPVFQGFGIGILFVLASTITYATIPHELQVEASSVFALVRGIGQAIAISVTVAMVSRYSQINHAEMSERLTPLRPFVAQSTHGVKELFVQNMLISREAAMMAYNNAYLALCIAAASAILAAFVVKPSTGAPNQDETHPVEL